MTLSTDDKYSQSQVELEARLAVLFGGREAEKLIFGEENVTTGASSDINAATQIAYRMVTEYGMSDLGSVRYSASDAAMQPKINDRVRKIIGKAEYRARTILLENKDELDALAGALLKHETLSGDEVAELLGIAAPDRPAGQTFAQMAESRRQFR